MPIDDDLAAAAADLPKLLTLVEAADLARVTCRTVRRWRDCGRLAAAKTDPGQQGRVLIPRAALLRLLAGV